jgi:cobalt transporter subunit CbtB
MTSQPAPTPSLPDHSRTDEAVSWQLIGAGFLAAFVFWGVAFSTSPLAHNAAHDVRHVAGTPCH